jgi:hypothetical protein
MSRSPVVGLMVAACALLAAGCEGAKTASSQAKEAAKEAAKGAQEATKEAQEVAKRAADAAKATFAKPIEDALPKIEEKIKGLKGDAMTKAQEKYESVKKMVEELKSVGPDKWESLKDGLTKAFDELKKLVGL